MKQTLTRLSRQYSLELEKYLHHGLQTDLQSAAGLGGQAVRLGLETLELARIHELALVTLDLSTCRHVAVKRAGRFFAEAHTPIEETHRCAQQARPRLGRALATLERRTKELAVSKRKLARGPDQVRLRAAAPEWDGTRRRNRLAESRWVQTHLQQLARNVMADQEHDRATISHGLQNDIAQTLLGIQVGLLTLKAAARINAKGMKKEITSTQRLVVSSARSVRRSARRIRAACKPNPEPDRRGSAPPLPPKRQSRSQRGLRRQLAESAPGPAGGNLGSHDAKPATDAQRRRKGNL